MHYFLLNIFYYKNILKKSIKVLFTTIYNINIVNNTNKISIHSMEQEKIFNIYIKSIISLLLFFLLSIFLLIAIGHI